MQDTADFLDLVLKLCSFAGVVICAQFWFIRKVESGQAALRQHHAEDNQRLVNEIRRTIKQLSKKVKKKVSKEDCENFRRSCPRGCLSADKDKR